MFDGIPIPPGVSDELADLIGECLGGDDADKAGRVKIIEKLAEIFDKLGEPVLAKRIRDSRYDFDRFQSICEELDAADVPAVSP
jgi:hypothetical protein